MSEPAAERWHPRTIKTVPTSRTSLEAVAEDARQRGFAEGLAQGQAEAKKQSQQTAAELNALWQAMTKPLADNDSEVTEHLLGLVLSLTNAVLARELTTDSDFIKRTLDEALAHLAESTAQLTVELNPADKSLVATLLDEKRLSAELVSDDTVLRGGCRLTREHALVDASIESRIKSLLLQMVEAGPSPGHGEKAISLDADRIQAIADRFSGNQYE